MLADSGVAKHAYLLITVKTSYTEGNYLFKVSFLNLFYNKYPIKVPRLTQAHTNNDLIGPY